MKIKKIGHCCLVIDHNGKRILTDPGAFSKGQENVKNIDLILITHDHQDHIHIESLQRIIKNNPTVEIYTNESVGKILAGKNISFKIVDDGKTEVFKELKIEGIGKTHALIHDSIPLTENTGYFIDEQLFYPGDQFTDPKKQVPILALPVAGPWTTIRMAINYGLKIKPKKCFPVHDGMIKPEMIGVFHNLPKRMMEKNGTEFISLNEGDEYEF